MSGQPRQVHHHWFKPKVLASWSANCPCVMKRKHRTLGMPGINRHSGVLMSSARKDQSSNGRGPSINSKQVTLGLQACRLFGPKWVSIEPNMLQTIHRYAMTTCQSYTKVFARSVLTSLHHIEQLKAAVWMTSMQETVSTQHCLPWQMLTLGVARLRPGKASTCCVRHRYELRGIRTWVCSVQTQPII